MYVALTCEEVATSSLVLVDLQVCAFVIICVMCCWDCGANLILQNDCIFVGPCLMQWAVSFSGTLTIHID